MVIINCKSVWTRYYKIGKVDWRWGKKHHLQTAVELDENGNITEVYLIRYWGIRREEKYNKIYFCRGMEWRTIEEWKEMGKTLYLQKQMYKEL